MSGSRAPGQKPWRIPAMLAACTLLGLVLALTGGAQPWRTIAWGLLSAPLIGAAVAWAWFARRRGRA